MRIGIISDIHSNILALKETIKEFEKRKVDKIICLGDIIGIGPYPEQCIEFLMNYKKISLVIVKGNHENYLINGIPRKHHNEKDAKPMNDEEISTHVWNHSRLNNEHIKFIKSLYEKDCIEINGTKIVIEHYPMDKNNKFKKFIKEPMPNEIEELFEEKLATIYLFGHTHKKHFSQINNKYYINPGSLGCPINSNGINAGILELNDDKIQYEQLEIKYNIESVINEIKKLNYPLSDFMIKTFYINN